MPAPIASTFKAPIPLATVSNGLSPESVRPLPKAPPSNNKVSNRCKVKSNVLTDTLTKNDFAASEDNRKTKRKKRRISKVTLES